MATFEKTTTFEPESSAKENVNAVRESFKTLIETGTERAAHLRDDAMARGRRAVGTLQHFVEEKPIQALGMAFAAGVIIGGLLLWRR